MPVRCPDSEPCDLDCGDARDPLCARALCEEGWPEDGGFIPVEE